MSAYDRDSRTWGMLCHLAGLAILVAGPGVNIIAPLVIWLIKREESAFIDRQGRESLNFQISVTIYLAVSGLLCLALIGFALAPIVLITDVILVIVAAIKANNGESYRYPLTIRFIK